MAIFLTKDSKVIVQGITGGEATKHTARMLKAGTQIVGGVNARKAGTTVSHKDVNDNDVELPVFGSVAEAIEKTGADVSIAFVPPKFAKDAITEVIDAEIPLLVVITEGIPVQDSAYAWVEVGEDRVDRAGLDARVAVDADRGIDVELLRGLEVRRPRLRVNAVDRADLDAGVVLDAAACDDVRHELDRLHTLQRRSRFGSSDVAAGLPDGRAAT